MDQTLFELSQRVGRALKAKGAWLATAESCTGGWVAKVLTDVPGSSGWVDRGFVTYTNEAKQEMLGVSEATLREHGAVSEQTVREMAA
ncbi:MAG TPA: nicotinamide-nucleotide amidohydrolase family protein, partial [Gammaproteobacteria bacterium]|nr:nicotinamide-nucleotide amidohydrolase family protein [Gammaproteobacteria bacterium]